MCFIYILCCSDPLPGAEQKLIPVSSEELKRKLAEATSASSSADAKELFEIDDDEGPLFNQMFCNVNMFIGTHVHVYM